MPPRPAHPSSPRTDAVPANGYTREVRRRQAAREAGLDAETIRGLHRNAGESAFASLMLAPDRYRPAGQAATARPATSGGEAAPGLRRPRRRSWWIGLFVAAAVLAVQGMIVLGWWMVFQGRR